MADENVETKTDVNTAPAPSVESSTQETSTNATPPTGEQPGAKVEDKRIPYDRFSEVVKERNREREERERIEARLRDMESRLAGNVASRPQEEDEANRLVAELGMDKEAAKKLVGTMKAISQRERAAVEGRMRQYEIAEWERGLQSKYKDYNELTPQMEKVFNALHPDAQKLVVASPDGLEMLYSKAKQMHMDKVAADAYQRGADTAKASKDLKTALSNAPGSGSPAPKGELSPEAIAKMSIKEYKERLPEINEWLSKRR